MNENGVRLAHSYFSVSMLAEHQQSVAQLDGSAQLHSPGDRAVRTLMPEIENAVGFNPATPIIILILDGSDRAKPICEAVEQVDAEVHQNASARKLARKIKPRRALPFKFPTVLPIIRTKMSELLRPQ